MAIIDRIDWAHLDQVVEVEQRNRECHAPAISFFRWWARRPHAVVGAILDAARLEFDREHFIVADPFSGGGTVAYESIRRGLHVYAQDLYPWPSFGLGHSLRPTDPDKLANAADDLLARLTAVRELYQYREGGATWEITHILRVRVTDCSQCTRPIFLFRDPFVSLASRRHREERAFFGCPACGHANLRKKKVRQFVCSRCRLESLASDAAGGHRNSALSCPHCRRSATLSQLLAGRPAWHPFLIQKRAISPDQGRVVVLGVPDSLDTVRDSRSVTLNDPLRKAIPPGVETNPMLRAGFSHWSDLYTQRQLHALRAALHELDDMPQPTAVKDRLRLAILGAAEMPGYLCRWSRTHPKTFEAIANHRYSRSTVVSETNLLSPIGRGTLPRRFSAAVKGLRWLCQTGLPQKVTIRASRGARQVGVKGAVVVTGSSERQLLRDGAARLVLTDPPYHDDLQYGELSRLFHAWLRVAMKLSAPNEAAEAVPNAKRGTDTNQYERLVGACLKESRRTLAADGRLVLTFHNNNIEAWRALSNALIQAGLQITALAAVMAENPSDHSKRNKRAFVHDLVVECKPVRSGSTRNLPVSTKGQKNSSQKRNLLAIGMAMANFVNKQELVDDDGLHRLYVARLEQLLERQVLIE